MAIEAWCLPLHSRTTLRNKIVEWRPRYDLVREETFNWLPISMPYSRACDGNAKSRRTLEHIHNHQINIEAFQFTQFEVVCERNVGLSTAQPQPVVADASQATVQIRRNRKRR